MRITPAIFDAFLKCATKCHLRSIGEIGSGNEYAEWVRCRTNQCGVLTIDTSGTRWSGLYMSRKLRIEYPEATFLTPPRFPYKALADDRLTKPDAVRTPGTTPGERVEFTHDA